MQKISNLRIKKNDTVKVLAGRDRGKQGKVTQVFPKQRMVVVDGVNLRSKHLKGRRGNQAGSKIQYAAPLPSSKVMVICTGCGKATRVRMVLAADGRRVRTCHHCQQPIASS